MDLNCLGSTCEERKIDRWRIEQVMGKVGVREKTSDRVHWKAVMWFRHVGRMSWRRLIKRVYVSDVEGRRNRGRPCTRRLDGSMLDL